MSEYTPGPWAWDEYETCTGDCDIADSLRSVGVPNTDKVNGVPFIVSPGQLVLFVDATTGGDKIRVDTPNARLIAAAPDLLEALEAAQEHLDYCGYGDAWERECAQESCLMEQIEAAIAKAKGE